MIGQFLKIAETWTIPMPAQCTNHCVECCTCFGPPSTSSPRKQHVDCKLSNTHFLHFFLTKTADIATQTQMKNVKNQHHNCGLPLTHLAVRVLLGSRILKGSQSQDFPLVVAQLCQVARACHILHAPHPTLHCRVKVKSVLHNQGTLQATLAGVVL